MIQTSPQKAHTRPISPPSVDVCGRRGRGGCAPAQDMALDLPGQIVDRVLHTRAIVAPVPVRQIL